MDTRAAHGGEPGALASPRAKAARPEVVGSNPTGPTIIKRHLEHVSCSFRAKELQEHPELHFNRQQFAETAIREKVERARMLEQGSKEERLIFRSCHSPAE